MSLRPYQTTAVDAVELGWALGDAGQCLVLPTGCHRPGQGILMHDGSIRRVEDVRVGDLLMGPDSSPRRVMALCRGTGRMVRVVPNKGEPFVVNEDHVLTLVRTAADPDGYPSERGGALVDVTVREWMGWSAYRKHVHKLFRAGVEFPGSSGLPISPYFLGVLLGDGCMRHGVGVTKPDVEILALVTDEAAARGLAVRTDSCGGRCPTHYVTAGNRGGAGTNSLTTDLRTLGLHGCGSEDKFIPHAYKIAARPERMALLAGLMDSDGSVARTGYDFVSKSEVLARDTAFLARSLGFAAYVSPCRKRAQTGPERTYFRVSISGSTSEIPCRLPRKRPQERRQKKDVLRTGFSVEELGAEAYYGFTLDGDGRYLLGDFTVTHNSGKTVAGIEIASRELDAGGVVIWLAHLDLLLGQAVRAAQRHGLTASVIGGDDRHYDPRLRLQVGSMQTIARRLGRVSRVVKPTLIVVDESHRVAAPSYRAILDAWPDARRLGLTATPWRLTAEPLRPMLTAIVAPVSPGELVAAGYLVAPAWRTPAAGRVDTAGLRKRAGEYVASEVEAAVKAGLGDIVRAIALSVREGRGPVAVFAGTIATSLALRDALRAELGGSPGRVEHIDADTDSDTRDAILGEKGSIASGACDVVTNVGVLDEGVDCPGLGTVVLAAPTASSGRFLQRVGRGLRPAAGKERCYVLDYGGHLDRHWWPLEDIRPFYDLDGAPDAEKVRQAKGAVEPRQCPRCFGVYPSRPVAAMPSLTAWPRGTPCPGCGYVAQKAVEVVDRGTQLVERDAGDVVSWADKWAAWREIVAWGLTLMRDRQTGQLRRPEPKALGCRYKARFGAWPPQAMWAHYQKAATEQGVPAQFLDAHGSAQGRAATAYVLDEARS